MNMILTSLSVASDGHLWIRGKNPSWGQTFQSELYVIDPDIDSYLLTKSVHVYDSYMIFIIYKSLSHLPSGYLCHSHGKSQFYS